MEEKEFKLDGSVCLDGSQYLNGEKKTSSKEDEVGIKTIDSSSAYYIPQKQQQ